MKHMLGIRMVEYFVFLLRGLTNFQLDTPPDLVEKHEQSKSVIEIMHLSYLTILTALFFHLEANKTAVGRLPKWLVPLSYRVDIVTRINQPYQPFGGTVVIDLRSERSTKRIVLNAHDLAIGKRRAVTLSDKNGNSVPVSSIQMDIKLSRLTVSLKRPLKVNVTYSMRVAFTSVLRNDNTGFYSSNYVDHNTTLTQWLAATQFEPNHAREAFPCFDDPIFRTPFKINLAHPYLYRALSNMPVQRTIRQ